MKKNAWLNRCLEGGAALPIVAIPAGTKLNSLSGTRFTNGPPQLKVPLPQCLGLLYRTSHVQSYTSCAPASG